MYEIINTKQKSNTVELNEFIHNENQLICAVTDDDFFLMNLRLEGYLFTNITNMEYGHSGYHSTAKDCIQTAMGISDSKIYIFNSYKEAFEFWNNKLVLKKCFK